LLQFIRPSFGQRIDNPILFPPGAHHASITQVSEMLRNLDLWLAENVLKMTDAERRSCEKMENAQPRAIAKALIDLDQIHVA